MWYVVIITPRRGIEYNIHGPYARDKVWQEAALSIKAAQDEDVYIESVFIAQKVDPDRMIKELL